MAFVYFLWLRFVGHPGHHRQAYSLGWRNRRKGKGASKQGRGERRAGLGVPSLSSKAGPLGHCWQQFGVQVAGMAQLSY